MACSASGRLAIGRWKLMMIGLATPTRAPLTGLNAGGANTGSPVNGAAFWPLAAPIVVATGAGATGAGATGAAGACAGGRAEAHGGGRDGFAGDDFVEAGEHFGGLIGDGGADGFGQFIDLRGEARGDG